jgi:hypothetical protein
MEIDWRQFWDIFSGIILPDSGTLVWNLVLYGVLSFAVAILLLVLGQRFKAFHREQKYYNWAVKLYIPLILLGTLYFGLQVGLFRGIYKVADAEAPRMSGGIYALTVNMAFEGEAEKKVFLDEMKGLLVTYRGESKAFAQELKRRLMEHEIGVGVVDQAIQGVSGWLIDQFQDELFSAILASVMAKAAEKAGIPVELSWSESAKVVEVLLATNVSHLETEIQHKLTETLQHLFHKQYSSMRNSTLLLWLGLIVLLPLVEWLVYLKWIRPWLRRRAAIAMDLV